VTGSYGYPDLQTAISRVLRHGQPADAAPGFHGDAGALGGNFGELVYMMGGSVLGLGASLSVRQILATNLITDALPAFAVAVQEPEHRDLSMLRREGGASLGTALKTEIRERAFATSGPALAAFFLARRSGSIEMARSVGFATIVSTQLALTLEHSQSRGTLTRTVMGAVAASGAAAVALLTIPALRRIFGFQLPTPVGWGLILGGALAAPVVTRLLPTPVPENVEPPGSQIIPIANEE